MFKQTLKQSPLILPISNLMKGGDFMGVEQDHPAIDAATQEALSRIEGLREAEQPWGYRPFEPDDRKDPRAPRVRGRTRFGEVPEAAVSPNPLLRQL